MKARQASVSAQFQWAIRAAILLVALVLRSYRPTGFVLNQDEAHWLLYSLDKNLLFESLKNSHPRPEVLFPILSCLPIRLFGPNELAMRLLCALVGSFSIFPLESFVKRLTRSNTAALAAAAMLAVSPLHVYFSSQGIPDVIALFFLLWTLACFARAAETIAKIDFVMFGSCLALALVSKANSLYFWLCLWVISALFFRGSRQRNMSLLALGGAAIPLVALTAVIRIRSPTLSFFQEPGVTTRFTITLGKIGSELSLCWLYLGVSIIAATLGVLLLATRERSGLSPEVMRARLWAFLTPLVTLLIAPYFRVTAKDLLLLLPTVCLFGAIALNPITPVRSVFSVAVLGVSLAHCLWGIPIPAPPRPSSAMARTTAVLARPAGWPSRDACRWLVNHTTSEDAVLVTAFTFTDPLVLELQAQRKVISNAGSNWELLRDPASRIKYVVFIEDYRAYAAQFAQFADAHFSRAPDADFPNYTIYDCQRDGRFVAYPDAFNSCGFYVQHGVKLLHQKRCDEAIKAFKNALQADLSSLAAKHDLMTAYLECDRQNDAVRIGAELLQQEPADPTLNVNMAILYLELGRLEDGLAQCRKNIRLNIAPAISYGVLGQLLEKQGDLPSARDAYEKSLALDLNSPVTTSLLSNVLTKFQQHAPMP
jgi:Flp pilus assembly protein TadD